MTRTVKTAELFRMVMPTDTCPYGLKAKHLLERAGYRVEDRHLTTREAVDAFKAEHDVATTPQVFIDGARIGGHDDLRRFLGTGARHEDSAAGHDPGHPDQHCVDQALLRIGLAHPVNSVDSVRKRAAICFFLPPKSIGVYRSRHEGELNGPVAVAAETMRIPGCRAVR